MKITIHLLGQARQLAATGTVELELPEGASVNDAIAAAGWIVARTRLAGNGFFKILQPLTDDPSALVRIGKSLRKPLPARGVISKRITK